MPPHKSTRRENGKVRSESNSGGTDDSTLPAAEEEQRWNTHTKLQIMLGSNLDFVVSSLAFQINCDVTRDSGGASLGLSPPWSLQ